MEQQHVKMENRNTTSVRALSDEEQRRELRFCIVCFLIHAQEDQGTG